MGEQKLLLPHQTCCGIGKHSSVQAWEGQSGAAAIPCTCPEWSYKEALPQESSNPKAGLAGRSMPHVPEFPVSSCLLRLHWGGASLPSLCVSTPQVPRRKVPVWCSWWTCGIPTWRRLSAKPSTSSSRRDDDGAARPGGFRAARPGSSPGSRPRCSLPGVL